MKNSLFDDYDLRRVHSIQSINSKQKIYLESKEFKQVTKTNFYGKKKKYLVKRFPKESARHMIVIYEATRFLKRFAKDIQTYRSVRPDIIFKFNDRSYAIEVETGTTYTKSKEKLKEKVKMLNKEFEDRWCFLVTDRNFKKKYEKYGTTFDKRNFRKGIVKFLMFGEE